MHSRYPPGRTLHLEAGWYVSVCVSYMKVVVYQDGHLPWRVVYTYMYIHTHFPWIHIHTYIYHPIGMTHTCVFNLLNKQHAARTYDVTYGQIFLSSDVRCGYAYKKWAGGTKTRPTCFQYIQKLYGCIENLKRNRMKKKKILIRYSVK